MARSSQRGKESQNERLPRRCRTDKDQIIVKAKLKKGEGKIGIKEIKNKESNSTHEVNLDKAANYKKKSSIKVGEPSKGKNYNVKKQSISDVSFEDLESKIFEEPQSFRSSRTEKKVTKNSVKRKNSQPDAKSSSTKQNKTNAVQKSIKKEGEPNKGRSKQNNTANLSLSSVSTSKVKTEPSSEDNQSDPTVNTRKQKKTATVPKTIKKEKEPNSRQNKQNNTTKFSGSSVSKPSCSKVKSEPGSESEESDMEDIDELDEIMNIGKSDSKASVQVELESTNVLWGMTNRKKRSENEKIQDYLRKEVNRSIKVLYENMHKTHILCLIAHGRYVNKSMNSEEAMAKVLSIVPKNAYPKKRLDIKHLQTLLSWFIKKFNLDTTKKPKDSAKDFPHILSARIESQECYSEKEAVVLFVLICRVLGVSARFVMNLTPMSWKPPTRSLIRPAKKSPTPEPPVIKTKVKKMNSKRLVVCDSDEESKPTKTKKNGKKVISSDSEDENQASKTKKGKKSSKTTKEASQSKKKNYFSFWAEVFCEEEERWISVDVSNKKVHFSPDFQNKLAPNSAYILAFSQDLSVKDVTKRYISSFLSCRDKWRLNNDWWEASVDPFRGIPNNRDKAEDEELDKFLQTQPLPKKISDYKNHPLYALQRHLLKFEALYPPNVSPVGHFRGEPVYPRESVKTLLSRERWIKEGKTIKVGEEPYKIVTRLKYDRNTNTLQKNVPLDVFGDWQIEDYEPPTAVNGKVPRNEYGNVELFKMSMLPKGCVYIQLPGLNKIARKLGIDCATAVTGFDFHGGWNHPVMDGFVVCTEFENTLTEAWQQEQAEIAKREEATRVRTIYANWKKLIKGMLVREKIWTKYGDDIVKEQNEMKEKCKNAKKVDKKKKEGNPEKKKAPPKKKIKQEDISAIKPMVTHEVADLRIDFESSAADRKTKVQIPSTSGTYSNLNVDDSSSEEESQEIKQEKMRNILNWKPKGEGPNLSDASGDEMEQHESPKVSSKPTKRSSKRQRTPSEPSLSEGSTSESEVEVKPKKRLRRSIKRAKLSSESEEFDDSDVDKDFQPAKKH